MRMHLGSDYLSGSLVILVWSPSLVINVRNLVKQSGSNLASCTLKIWTLYCWGWIEFARLKVIYWINWQISHDRRWFPRTKALILNERLALVLIWSSWWQLNLKLEYSGHDIRVRNLISQDTGNESGRSNVRQRYSRLTHWPHMIYNTELKLKRQLILILSLFS
jgi:hypothetical protein